MFLGQDDGPGFRPKWFLDYGYTVFGENQRFNLHVNDFNRERLFVGSDPVTPPTDWTALAVTINNVASGEVRFYMNGDPIGVTGLGNYVLRTHSPLLFGRAEGLRFSGLMADVRIYNRVLSPSEVKELSQVPDAGAFFMNAVYPLLGWMGWVSRKTV